MSSSSSVGGPNKPSSSSSTSSSSYGVFSAVDDLVSKPILGSDGAASWQAFQKTSSHQQRQGPSVAPRAPLKKADRLGTGLTSWEDERRLEDQTRQQSGHASLAQSGYTTFKKKQQNGGGDTDLDDNDDNPINRKKREQILSKKMPDDVEYFIPSKTFEGWKFDYVFTTRKTYGTGYYWDGTDSIKRLNGDKSLSDTTSTTTHQKRKIENGTVEEVDSHKKKMKKDKKDKKTKKKKDKKGPVIVSDPNNPLEQIHTMLEQRRIQQQQQNQYPYNYHQQQQHQQQPQDLPPGWESASDPTTGKQYYFHRTSGERRWDKPEQPPSSEIGNDPNPKTNKSNDDSDGDLPDGWESSKDPTSGKVYYFHRAEGKTSWVKPTTYESSS